VIGIDAAGVEIQVIRIGAGRIIVGVCGALIRSPLRHVENVLDADFGARVAGDLPLRNRRG